MDKKDKVKHDKKVGIKLRSLRKYLDMTQEDMASKLGISARLYQDIEGGKKGLSVERCIKIKKEFHVSIDYILCNDKDTNFKLLLESKNVDRKEKEILNTLLKICGNEEVVLIKVLEDILNRIKKNR